MARLQKYLNQLPECDKNTYWRTTDVYYKNIVGIILQKFKAFECYMNLKVHFLHGHPDHFLEL